MLENKNETKSKTLEGLLKIFKENIYTQAKDWDINTLKNSNIKKDKDGYYHLHQFVDIFSTKLDPKTRNIPDVYNNDLVDDVLPLLQLDIIKTFDRTVQIQAYDFSLLLFNKGINEYIKDFRKKLNIPNNGLNTDSRLKWMKEETKNLFKLGLLKDNKISELHSFIDIFNIKILKIYLGEEYQFKINRNFFSFMMFDYLTLNDPFYSINNFKTLDEACAECAISTRYPKLPEKFKDDNFELHIVIYKQTGKDEVKRAIENNWDMVENYKKRLPTYSNIRRIKGIDFLKEKWQVYKMYEDGFSNKQIAIKLKINETSIRKIISEIKKEIKKLKM